MDETKLAFGFIHARELHYRPFALHIAHNQSVIFGSAKQGVGGS